MKKVVVGLVVVAIIIFAVAVGLFGCDTRGTNDVPKNGENYGLISVRFYARGELEQISKIPAGTMVLPPIIIPIIVNGDMVPLDLIGWQINDGEIILQQYLEDVTIFTFYEDATVTTIFDEQIFFILGKALGFEKLSETVMILQPTELIIFFWGVPQEFGIVSSGLITFAIDVWSSSVIYSLYHDGELVWSSVGTGGWVHLVGRCAI